MHILAFNWKDITHPYAGGAETNIHEQARRWVKQGHTVTLYCPRYKGSAKKEIIDGIHIYRAGGRFTTYLLAPFAYLFTLRKQCDVILDIENGIPFFTPLFSGKPILLQMHHVHKHVFFKELSPLIAWFPYILETILMPMVYRNNKIIAVSQSTADATIHLGFSQNQIRVIYNGIRIKPLRTPGKKAPYPTIIYLGRMMKYKRLATLLTIFQAVQNDIPHARLHLVGNGQELPSLKALTQKKQITNVHFYDFVTEQKKIQLLRSAWLFATPSSLEGWGITVIEANACGTPSVSFDVPGLREAIRHNSTGLVANTTAAMHDAILHVLRDTTFRTRLSRNALQWSRRFTWDHTATQTMRYINEVLHETP